MPTKDNLTEWMAEARERYAYALSCDQEDRADAVEDVNFVAGNQWEEKVVRDRVKAKRPILTENRLQTYVAQVVNDGRQSKPSIKITPLDGGDPKTAEMLQSRIRHIEYESDAEIAYDTAREQQVTSGRGFYRAKTQYVDDDSFEQEVCIERIDNQFSVLFDPSARKYDKSDAEWCFVITNYGRPAYERKFGKSTTAARHAFYANEENPAPDWINCGKDGKEIQVAEYWCREYGPEYTICELADGSSVPFKDVPEGAQVIQQRKTRDCTIVQYVIDGVDILDETEWLGSTIPIVPLTGKELTVNGKRRTYSLVRFAKDPQRLLNLYVSNIAEQIALMPKNPYTAPVGAVANFEQLYATANLSPNAVLPYNQYDSQGRELRPPSREVNEPPIQALVAGYLQAVDAIKASMGIFDASIGNRGNETSGIAIQRRQRESDNANFHFHDNEARSRRYLGRIVLELDLKLAARKGQHLMTVRSEDGKTRQVHVNTPTPYRDEKTGEEVHYQLGEGADVAYGVAVSTGPSYTSARQEAAEMYGQLAQADKNFMMVAGDLFFDSLDMPGADLIAERYRKVVVPPQALQQGQQQVPPEVQRQMAALTQEVQVAHAFAQKLYSEQQAKTLEMESREKIAAMQEETKRTIALAQLDAADGVAMLKAEIAGLELKAKQLHEQVMQAADHQHQQTMASQQQQAQVQQQREAQAHQADQQIQAQDFQAQQAAEQQPATE